MSARSQRARRLLAGKGVTREDSDDELGTDDELSWEWLRSAQSGPIVGARFGRFECHLGDCVLLKAESAKEAWVAIVCEFRDGDDGEKAANFMWFSTEREIRNQRRKRHDSLENELYITPSFDWNPLATINGSARVMSLEMFLDEFPSGKVPLKSKHRGKVFVCRRGCNTRAATYTPEFRWEEIYQGADELHGLIHTLKAQTKVKRQVRREDSSANLMRDSSQTKRPRILTSSNVARQQAVLTDAAPVLQTVAGARINQKRHLEYTPLGTRQPDLRDPEELPYQAARSRLHLSCIPRTLPCREAAFEQVSSHLEAAIIEGAGSCIYISGTPGTGKTATVREVIAQMNAAVDADEIDDFVFVEINGMKIPDPHQAYALLWEALHGERVSPSHALTLLNAEFGKPSPRRIPCVVLMDELDQLATKNQGVMYNFFNWPSLAHSRLIVLAVANTMDLPERTLSNKISSRLGLIRITFAGYTYDQLMKIIRSRLEGTAEDVFEPDAIQFASRKVAAVSGDARRAIEICRRAVELAEGRNTVARRAPDTHDVDTQDVSRKHAPLHRVSISIVKEAIKEATSNPFQELVKNLPWTARVLLMALVTRSNRNGTSESTLADTVAEARRQIQLTSSLGELQTTSLLRRHARHRGPEEQPGFAAPGLEVLETGYAALLDAGIIEVEARRQDRVGRIRLAVRPDDVVLALKYDNELQGFNSSD